MDYEPNPNKKLDLYKILELESNASQIQIKNSYKRLALKYHPDKNKLDNSNEKFIEIKYAYDILSNEKSRKEYDLHIKYNNPNNFNDNFRFKPDDFDYKIFTLLNTSTIISYLKNITSDKNYINLIDILYSKLKNQELTINLSSWDLINSISKVLDLEHKIEYSIKEIYDNVEKRINLNRVTKNTFIEPIYPIDFEQIYESEGESIEISGVKLEGNVKISIKLSNDEFEGLKYMIVGKDLYCKINIEKNLNENINKPININFLDGNTYSINLIDLLYSFDSLNNKQFEKISNGYIYKIENKGLCYYDTDSDEIDLKLGMNILRGNVFFILLI